MPVDICGHSAPDCVAIDFTTPNAALDNARIAFPSASSHENTRQAIGHLLECLEDRSDKGVMIVGHGRSGVIVTGSGESPDDNDKKIAFGNFHVWRDELARLKDNITGLTFCSCETAAPEKGPKLLRKVANTVGARVYGFTRMIFINSQGKITCENGGQWLFADPGARVRRVRRQSYRFKAIMKIKLKDDGRFRTRQISQVSAIKYWEKIEALPLLSLEGERAQILASMVDFASPQEIDAAPLALVTGVIEIRFNNESTRLFTVFNDRLLQDRSAPDTFYFASPEFSAALSESRSPLG